MRKMRRSNFFHFSCLVNGLTLCLILFGGGGIVTAVQAVECGDTIGPKPPNVVRLQADIGPCTTEPALTIIGPITVDLKDFTIWCEDGTTNGIVLEGSRAVIKRGTISGCLTGVTINGGERQVLNRITVQDSTADGVVVNSNKARITRSTATGSALVGFRIRGNNSVARTNTAIGNAQGFLDEGTANKLISNTALGNTDDSFVTEGIRILATRDSRLMESHPDDNTGIYERLNFKTGNGTDRTIVGFDLPSLAASDVSQALLVLTVEHLSNLGGGGVPVSAYRIRETWTEGNARFERWKKQKTVPGSGTGVTWNCPNDLDIANDERDCANPWTGGVPSVETPNGSIPDGASPTDTVQHLPDLEFAVWDVTPDVHDALDSSLPEVGWVVAKDVERRGGARYFSREGAALLTAPLIAPALILKTN